MLEIRKVFLTAKVAKNWNILPREAVKSSSLEVFYEQVTQVSIRNGVCIGEPALEQQNRLDQGWPICGK